MCETVSDIDADLAEIELGDIEEGDEVVRARGHYESGEWRIQQRGTVERVGIAPGALPPEIEFESGDRLASLNDGTEQRLYKVV